MTKPGQTPSRAQARKTALVVASVLLLIAAGNLYRRHLTVAGVFGTFGLVLLLVGLLSSRLARQFHIRWMQIAVALGYVNSRILLCLVFYLVVTPYGVISRLVGRDVLQRRGRRRGSYWVARPYSRQSKEQFERLF